MATTPVTPISEAREALCAASRSARGELERARARFAGPYSSTDDHVEFRRCEGVCQGIGRSIEALDALRDTQAS